VSCAVWFGLVCAATWLAPRAARWICRTRRPPGASITINHRHTFMYLTAHDGTGSSGEKGGAASRHCRIGRQTQTPFLHLCLPTAPCPALPRPASTRRSVRSPHHHRTLALTLEPGSRPLDVVRCILRLYLSSSAAATHCQVIHSSIIQPPNSAVHPPTHPHARVFSSRLVSSPPSPPTSRTP
jgi:hypothetical protein